MKRPKHRKLFLLEREIPLAQTKVEFYVRREIPKQPDHSKNDECHSVDIDDTSREFWWFGGQPYTQTIYHTAPNKIGRIGEVVKLWAKDHDDLGLFKIENIELDMNKNVINMDAIREGFPMSYVEPPLFRYSVFCQDGGCFSTNELPVIGDKFGPTSIRDFVEIRGREMSPLDQWRAERLRRGLTLNPEQWTVAARLCKVRDDE